ncbi:MAG TPA: 5'-3' exonuclease H3TH domain-containing protein, partial [Prolixibacteraceae bacterium]|nr:5'-3' exonuclease H3TH domain-containing protein [Prolixibacteraceae bacterium]
MTAEPNIPKKLFLLDAYALIYRSYFAFIKNPRITSKGLNTSAIYGFVNSLEQVLNQEQPSHIAVAFDMHGDTFRHKMFAEYKANREAMPEDIRRAIPYVRQLIEAYNIPIIELTGFEADDIIGTIATKASEDGFTTYMMTPDKDYAQLVDQRTFMYKPAKGGNLAEVWGIEQVKENFEIEAPAQVIDILGLMGDSADNIPGCPGIGPKTAIKLISDYGNIDGVYENIGQLKGKLKESLETYKDQVFLSRKLAVIDRQVPITIDYTQMKYEGPNNEALHKLFVELEFRTFTSKIQVATQAVQQEATQGSLFDQPGVAASPQIITTQLETSETKKHQYYKVENAMQRASLRAELSVASAFCFDTETTGIDPHRADLVCISFSIKPHEAYCVILPEEYDESYAIVQEFKTLFEDRSIMKVGQNMKFDMLML